MMLCACLAENTIEKCMEKASKIDTRMIEHRIDYLDDIGPLDKLYQVIKQPVVSTIRPKWEGGRYTGSENSRLDIIKKAIDAECAAVDIELSTPKENRDAAVKYAKRKSALVILSRHVTYGTPSLPELIGLTDMMREQGADIGKLVTTANTLEDCNTIMELQKHSMTMEFPLVSFAMGKIGLLTRVSSLKYGAPFTYVSSGEETAPGQVNAFVMRMLMEEMI